MQPNESDNSDEVTKSFEIKVGDDGIIYLTLAGKFEGLNLMALEKWTKEVHKVVKDRYENTYATVKVIIDINEVSGYSPEAVTLLTNLLIEDKDLVYRSATFGGSEYILMAQDMLASLSGRTNFKSFNTKEEAIAWVTSTNS